MEELYAPVAKFVSIRALFTLATVLGWEMLQLDVKTAFLYPEIEEKIYMEVPEGYDNDFNKFCVTVLRTVPSMFPGPFCGRTHEHCELSCGRLTCGISAPKTHTKLGVFTIVRSFSGNSCSTCSCCYSQRS